MKKADKRDKNIEIKPDRPYVSAVVVAAGNSTRMGMNKSKQLIEICGKPVIAWTLLAFEQANEVDEVVIVCREQDIVNIYDIIAYFNITKAKTVIKGGASRQQSVSNGIGCVSEQTEFLAIHDGARPLILPQDIDKTVKAAYKYKAAALGVKVKDTIKITDGFGFIKNTPDRNNLFLIQTPQVFDKQLYLAALSHPNNAGSDYTDDCQLIESISHDILICEGSYSNIKITTQDDIHLAKQILQEREL